MTPQELHDHVLARLIEAAQVDDRLPASGLGPDGCKAFWPVFKHAVEDMKGWDAARLREHEEDVREAINRQCAPDEVSRAEQCMAWIISFVRRDLDRRAVWAYIRSLALGRRASFRGWCRSQGIAQMTGQRRAQAGLIAIEAEVANKPYLLGHWAGFGVLSNDPDFETDFATLDEPRPSPTAWMADDARPIISDDPEAIKCRDKELAAARERSRRRRIAMGLEVDEEEVEPA